MLKSILKLGTTIDGSFIVVKRINASLMTPEEIHTRVDRYVKDGYEIAWEFSTNDEKAESNEMDSINRD